MADLEAHGAAPHSASGPTEMSTAPVLPSSHLIGIATARKSCSSWEDDDEQAGLYDFAEELRLRDPAVEPWFLEGS